MTVVTNNRIVVTHRLMVMTAQVLLSAAFIFGYFLILYLFVSGVVKPPPDYKEMIMTLLGVLTASVMTIVNYWFSRQREAPAAPQGASQ